ncbi:hypothetical protein [Hanstruepera marina]|uniref:hypothetical protein n=1 Tax=Hanstruepera marina TaxID=2873265 RepID=UPI001CA7A12D|nr:hypothetical protein [Hanstruepera marina]
MKSIVFIILMSFSINAYCQFFNGDYMSNETSYKDNKNNENNFREKSNFNIAIFIEDNTTDGTIIIQDTRIPEKLLAYRITGRKDFVETGGRWIAIYNCIAEHLDDKKKETLTFFISRENELNLMVSDSTSSQMFFNLQKQ